MREEMSFDIRVENDLAEDEFLKEMNNMMWEHLKSEAIRRSQHMDKLILDGVDKDEFQHKFNEAKELGIEINLNMQKTKYSAHFEPVSLHAKYKNRETVVKYCLTTRYTTRLSQNGNVTDIKSHDVIQFIDYAKNLFLGKEK